MGKLDCHVLVGSPKEMVSFKIMRLFNIEQVTLCVFDDADAIVTTKLVKEHIIEPLNNRRKVLISSNIEGTQIDFMMTYFFRSDIISVNVKQCFAICPTNYEKLLAILTANEVIERLNVQGIVFFEVNYKEFSCLFNFRYENWLYDIIIFLNINL